MHFFFPDLFFDNLLLHSDVCHIMQKIMLFPFHCNFKCRCLGLAIMLGIYISRVACNLLLWIGQSKVSVGHKVECRERVILFDSNMYSMLQIVALTHFLSPQLL